MKSLLLSSCLVVFATGAVAGPKTKVSVLFQDFPEGTECGVTGGKGKISLQMRRGSPKITQKGFGETGEFFCKLPDGAVVRTDVNQQTPTDAKRASVTIYPDGRAYMTTSQGGSLVQFQFTDALR